MDIGYEPAWTLDGPIDLSYGSRGGGGFGNIRTGMSTGGARTLKEEIMDPEIFKTMIRDEKTGIYQLPNKADFGYNDIPECPHAVRFLELVPHMKGKHVNAHGITGDVAIVKSYVYDKYVLDNEFFVDLAWWIESIDGYIWMEGGETVKLPSKKAG